MEAYRGFVGPHFLAFSVQVMRLGDAFVWSYEGWVSNLVAMAPYLSVYTPNRRMQIGIKKRLGVRQLPNALLTKDAPPPVQFSDEGVSKVFSSSSSSFFGQLLSLSMSDSPSPVPLSFPHSGGGRQQTLSKDEKGAGAAGDENFSLSSLLHSAPHACPSRRRKKDEKVCVSVVAEEEVS